MVVRNYISADIKNPEPLIRKLLHSIPKSLIPKNGFPDFHITNSLFHSYGVMYQKYKPTGEDSEEEFYDFCKKQNVWAFSCMSTERSGDVYLGLRRRVEKNEDYVHSVEHVIFHEVGHHFYYQKGIDLTTDKSVVDFDFEHRADAYANACMLNYFQMDMKANGYYESFSERLLQIIRETTSMDIRADKLLRIGENLYKKYGVL